MSTQFGVQPRIGGSKFFPPSRPIVKWKRPEVVLAEIVKQARFKPDRPKDPPMPLTSAEKVLSVACTLFGCTKPEFLGDGRRAHLVSARRYAAYRLIKEFGFSTTVVGRMLGGRDHTTVLNYISDDRRRNQKRQSRAAYQRRKRR